jgi:hypothetical protein
MEGLVCAVISHPSILPLFQAEGTKGSKEDLVLALCGDSIAQSHSEGRTANAELRTPNGERVWIPKSEIHRAGN